MLLRPNEIVTELTLPVQHLALRTQTKPRSPELQILGAYAKKNTATEPGRAAAHLVALSTNSNNGCEGLTEQGKASRPIKYSHGKRGLCHT